jgi:hypothetical protein
MGVRYSASTWQQPLRPVLRVCLEDFKRPRRPGACAPCGIDPLTRAVADVGIDNTVFEQLEFLWS